MTPRRTNYAERRLQFTSSDASYNMAKSSDSGIPDKLVGKAIGGGRLSRLPVLILDFKLDNPKKERYIFEKDALKIIVSPNRQNSREYFAALYYDDVFLFGNPGLTPFHASHVLFQRKKWLYWETNWLPLFWAYKTIIPFGISSKEPSTKHVHRTFDRSHLDKKTLWVWESDYIKRKRVELRERDLKRKIR